MQYRDCALPRCRSLTRHRSSGASSAGSPRSVQTGSEGRLSPQSHTERLCLRRTEGMRVFMCAYTCVCVCLCTLPGSREQQPGPGGSAAVLGDTLTSDLYSISLCCRGWHKRKTQSDLIGCDWSCCASSKPSGTLIFVVGEEQEVSERGNDFMG